jgi:L-lysine exporter family protein LysE/ArgO
MVRHLGWVPLTIAQAERQMLQAPALEGFLLGLSLILAIGAQNAFVLRQGLLRQHVFAVCLVCAVSDALLIAAGVAGFGVAVQRVPALPQAMAWLGAAFLLWYGFTRLRAAARGDSLRAAAEGTGSLRAALTTCLAFTWLNPHVYLDTVVLLGSIAQGHPGRQWWFAAGAAAGSAGWFAALGYGAALLRPLFARPSAWRVLDAVIALVMLALATSLLLAAL